MQIQNNNITQNGGFGIASSANQTIFQTDINFNNFGSGTSVNGSGALLNLNDINNVYIHPNYKSPLTMDYTLGTKLSGYGQPGHDRYIGANISLTKNNKVIGAIQSPNRTRNIDFCGGFVQ